MKVESLSIGDGRTSYGPVEVSKVPYLHLLVVATGKQPLQPVGVMTNGQGDWVFQQ